MACRANWMKGNIIEAPKSMIQGNQCGSRFPKRRQTHAPRRTVTSESSPVPGKGQSTPLAPRCLDRPLVQRRRIVIGVQEPGGTPHFGGFSFWLSFKTSPQKWPCKPPPNWWFGLVRLRMFPQKTQESFRGEEICNPSKSPMKGLPSFVESRGKHAMQNQMQRLA